jgi:glucose-1-phosphate adenylyltransferase
VHSRLTDVWVVEQFQPHALNEHLLNGRPWDLDRNRGGLRIMPPFTGAHGEGFAGGNADVLYRHRALIEEFAPDEVVVMSSTTSSASTCATCSTRTARPGAA